MGLKRERSVFIWLDAAQGYISWLMMHTQSETEVVTYSYEPKNGVTSGRQGLDTNSKLAKCLNV